MEKDNNTSLILENGKDKFCISCGVKLSGRKRRYCSKDCRDLLIFALSWLKNLLLALHTNYATFSFTDSHLIINILSFFSREVSTFFYKRIPGKTPAESLKEVCKALNKEWYEKKQASRSKRAASEHLLKIGLRDIIHKKNVTPISINHHSKISRKLTFFNLNFKDLGENPFEQIKSAYRKEVKKHHPDYGGNPKDFINISEAYKDVLDCLNNPDIRTRSGLPGKWSYDGSSYKWSAPL